MHIAVIKQSIYLQSILADKSPNIAEQIVGKDRNENTLMTTSNKKNSMAMLANIFTYSVTYTQYYYT